MWEYSELALAATHLPEGAQFAACRRTDSAVKTAVDTLAAALAHTRVPSKLVDGDRELGRGLTALSTALAARIRLAHPATIGPFINADSSIVDALNLMDKAAADLNQEDQGLHLRPM